LEAGIGLSGITRKLDQVAFVELSGAGALLRDRVGSIGDQSLSGRSQLVGLGWFRYGVFERGILELSETGVGKSRVGGRDGLRGDIGVFLGSSESVTGLLQVGI
jgi:hypothetical protein